MTKISKSVVNFSFFLFFLSGAASIFYMDRIDGVSSFFIPSALVGFYGVYISIVIRRMNDADLADHYAETIYFMGFLFTLVSLAVLFYRFSSGFTDLGENEQISEVFSFIGISVTTSIAGVLLRNMVRAGYLIRHPEDQESIEKSYNLLKKIADNFSESYSGTFETIKIFLEERKENAAVFNEKEKEYLASLEAFTAATAAFCSDLSTIQGTMKSAVETLGSVLNTQSENISSLGMVTVQTAEITDRLKNDLSGIPAAEASESIRMLAEETKELDTVIDAVISILESKLESAGRV